MDNLIQTKVVLGWRRNVISKQTFIYYNFVPPSYLIGKPRGHPTRLSLSVYSNIILAPGLLLLQVVRIEAYSSDPICVDKKMLEFCFRNLKNDLSSSTSCSLSINISSIFDTLWPPK